MVIAHNLVVVKIGCQLISVVHLGIALVSVSVFHQLVCTIYIACQCTVIYIFFFYHS